MAMDLKTLIILIFSMTLIGCGKEAQDKIDEKIIEKLDSTEPAKKTPENPKPETKTQTDDVKVSEEPEELETAIETLQTGKWISLPESGESGAGRTGHILTLNEDGTYLHSRIGVMPPGKYYRNEKTVLVLSEESGVFQEFGSQLIFEPRKHSCTDSDKVRYPLPESRAEKVKRDKNGIITSISYKDYPYQIEDFKTFTARDKVLDTPAETIRKCIP